MAITLSEERGVRFLHFGTPWIQGAMRIARPWALELEYTQDLMAPLLLRPADWPRSALVVGLGAGSVTKFLHRYRPEARLTVVEIDPTVLATARQYFRLPDEGAKLRVVIGDAADHVAAGDHRHDLIVLDGYDDHGRAGMLDSVPFYANCRRRLARGGFLSANLLRRTRGVKASVDRLREAFDGNVLVLPPCKAGNTVALAAAEPEAESFEALARSAARVKSESGLDLQPLVARLRAEHPGRMISLSS